VLKRQSSEVRVRYKAADSFPVSEHCLKNRPVLLAWMDHSHAWLIKPALDTLDGFLETERTPV
jgi:hypothetical protein